MLLTAITIAVLILLKINKPQENDTEIKINELKDRILTLEAQLNTRLESAPEMIRSKVSEDVQKNFVEFTSRIMERNQQLIEKFGEFQNNLTGSIGSSSKKITEDFSIFKDMLQKAMNDDFSKLNLIVEDKLDRINAKVRENLTEGFNKTNETFQNIIQRLAKIDEAQKNIENLSTNVVSLQSILTDKKTRGTFGEVQLNQILWSVFGEKNDHIFQVQHKLSNGKACDAILFAPPPTNNICIDSKFPLENYERMFIDGNNPAAVAEARKLFKINVKKHIDDISSKYIIPGETSDSAVMFVPAEAVFAEIHAYHEDIVNYANAKKVWITSPTTFIAVLNTLQIVLNNIERKKFADIIQQELKKLSAEFDRYRERWDKLSKHIDTVHKDVNDINITTDKISKRFDYIANAQFDKPHLESDIDE